MVLELTFTTRKCFLLETDWASEKLQFLLFIISQYMRTPKTIFFSFMIIIFYVVLLSLCLFLCLITVSQSTTTSL